MTQKSAAGAEESASAGEDLNSQATAMQDAVESLLILAGRTDQGHSRRPAAPRHAPPHTPGPRRAETELAPVTAAPLPTEQEMFPLDEDFQ